MPLTLNRPSFAAGELDPMFAGRVDMDKYHVGCRTLRNMIVHPHGGASKRQGTAVVGALPGDGRVIPFVFNAEQAYALVFTDGLLQIVMDGAFVANAVDIVDPDRWTWTATTHEAETWYYLKGLGGVEPSLPGTPTGIYLNGAAVAAGSWAFDDFDSLGYSTVYVKTATAPDTLAFGAYVARFAGSLQVDSPFAVADLQALSYCQSADTVFFAHPGYAPVKLVRYSHYTWRFIRMAFEPRQQSPASLTGTYSDTPGSTTRTIRYAVSAIGASGEESEMSDYESVVVDSPWKAGQVVSLSWPSAPGARQYNVWKSARGSWGLIGTTDILANLRKRSGTRTSSSDYSATYGKTKSYDGNLSTYWLSGEVGAAVAGASFLAIQFTSALAVTRLRLFQRAGFGVTSVKVQTSPDGTTWTDLVTLATDPDAGDWQTFDFNESATTATRWRILANSAAQDDGRWGVVECEFIGPTGGLSFTDDNVNEDTGEAPITLARPFSGPGDWPCCVALYQQRLWYGGTDNQPTTIWASRTGNLENFATSVQLRDDDAIEATLASRQADRVRHMIPLRDLAILTAGSEWRLVPGENGVVSPVAMQLAPQGYFGAAPLAPLAVNGSVLFLTRTGTEVRDLAYAFASDGYEGSNLTVLAGHLFRGQATPGLRAWDFAKYPDNVVWAVREDGELLGFTYLKEHDVWAWHGHALGAPAGGAVRARSLCVLPDDGDDGSDSVYMVVERTAGGVTAYSLEAMLPANAATVFLDGAVALVPEEKDVTIYAYPPWPIELSGAAAMLVNAFADGVTYTAMPCGLPLSITVDMDNGGGWVPAGDAVTLTVPVSGDAADLSVGWVTGMWSCIVTTDLPAGTAALRFSILYDGAVIGSKVVPVGGDYALVLSAIRERQTASGRTVWAVDAVKTLAQCITEVNAMATMFVNGVYTGGADVPRLPNNYATGSASFAALYTRLCAMASTLVTPDASTAGTILVSSPAQSYKGSGSISRHWHGLGATHEEAIAAAQAACIAGWSVTTSTLRVAWSTIDFEFGSNGYIEASLFLSTNSLVVSGLSSAIPHSAMVYRRPTVGDDGTARVFDKMGYDIPDNMTYGLIDTIAAGTWSAASTAWFPVNPPPAAPAAPPWPDGVEQGDPEYLVGWSFDRHDRAVITWDFAHVAATVTAVKIAATAGVPYIDTAAGATVVHADGTVEDGVSVAGGRVRLSKPIEGWAVVGYRYTGTLETMPLEVPADMTAQGKRKRVTAVSVRLFETREAWWGPSAERQDGPVAGAALWRTASPGDWTDHRVVFPAGWEKPGRVCITFPEPYPATVLEIMPEVLVGG